MEERDFRAEFDELFERCSLEDVKYIVAELEKYGWLDNFERITNDI